MREITSAARANLGAVTYHFGSKRGLYEEVLRRGLAPIAESLAEIASRQADPLDRLEAVVEALFDHFGANPDLPRLLLQEVAAGKAPPEAVREILQRNMGNVIAILAEGWEDGSVQRGDPTFSALSIVSQPIYMSMMAPLLRQLRGIDLEQPEIRRRAVDQVMQIVRFGLTTSQKTVP